MRFVLLVLVFFFWKGNSNICPEDANMTPAGPISYLLYWIRIVVFEDGLTVCGN